MNHFFAFLSRLKYIRRWSLMRSLEPENDMEHAAQAAILAHALAILTNVLTGSTINADRVATLALYHDSSEVITGDIATPIKYNNPEILRAYKSIEKAACVKLLSMLPKNLSDVYKDYMLPDMNTIEWRLVKAADTLSAYLKCVEELKAGNNEFRSAAAAIELKLRSLSIPAVDHFMNEFAASYSMSLDELA